VRASKQARDGARVAADAGYWNERHIDEVVDFGRVHEVHLGCGLVAVAEVPHETWSPTCMLVEGLIVKLGTGAAWARAGANSIASATAMIARSRRAKRIRTRIPIPPTLVSQP
jgi:hypothetical protein